jgi:hypothetical protein
MDRRIKLPPKNPDPTHDDHHNVDLEAVAKLGGGTVDQLRAVNIWMLSTTPLPGHEAVVPPGWHPISGEYPGGV